MNRSQIALAALTLVASLALGCAETPKPDPSSATKPADSSGAMAKPSATPAPTPSPTPPSPPPT